MIKIIVFLLQVVFVSFVSNIIQFTFVASMTIHLFMNINADTVRFHITHVVTKTHCQNFNDANDVLYETFTVKCFFRGKLQHAALVCVTKAFKIYKKKHERRKTLEKEMAIRDVKMMITIEDLLIVSWNKLYGIYSFQFIYPFASLFHLDEYLSR